jgi:hypothetical protein
MEILFSSFERYRDGTLDLSGLQQNASAVMSAMEGDVPKEVRDAVFSLEGDLDSILYTVSTQRQAEEVVKAFNDLEKLAAKYD